MKYTSLFLLKTVLPLSLVTMIVCLSLRREWLFRIIATLALIVVVAVLSVTKRACRLSATYAGQEIPVGSGWSFFLDKNRLEGIPLYAPSGKQESGWWGAGTTIRQLQSSLVREGFTLSSYPSIQNGTIGGWIASGSHGSGGTLWKPNFGNILVRDLVTGNDFIATPSELFAKEVSIAECRRYFILEVEVKPHKNVWCKKLASKILTTSDFDTFIFRKSYLRLLQIGRRGIFCLLWVPLEEGDEKITHIDPHFFSITGLWLQTDILSFIQSNDAKDKNWFNFPVEPAENYTSRIRLADASYYTPEPGIWSTPIGLLWINFEIFVMKYEATPDKLFKISYSLQHLFEEVWGRCEVRLGGTILFLDFNVYKSTQMSTIFDLLYELLYPHDIVLHRGKAQVDISPFPKKSL